MLARNAPRLPDWIGILVTSRPESNVKAPLQGLNPLVLDTATESNRADIREYLRHELASQLENRSDADRCVEQILEKSEGVFLYAEHVCAECQCGNLSLDHLDEFPQGLGGVFFQYFQRQFPDMENFRKHIRPALRAILAAREPLPVEILQRLFNWQDDELRDFIRPLGSLFPATIESGCETIKPYHKSLADWITDEARADSYFVSVAEGHRALADHCFGTMQQRIPATASRVAADYYRKHLLFHLKSCSRWEDIVTCISTPELFLQLAPSAYGVMYDKGLFGAVDAHAIVPQDLAQSSVERISILITAGSAYLTANLYQLSASERGVVAWSIAEAFAERAADALGKIETFVVPWKATYYQLRSTDGVRFADYRDTFYSFVYLCGTSPAFALAACESTQADQTRLRRFLNRYEELRKLLSRLSYSGAELTGLSGKLEDDALGLCDAWERLEALSQ